MAKGELSRCKLMDAQMSLLDEGTLAPTFSEIAARAMLSKRVAYNHFRNVPDLLLATLCREVTRKQSDLFPIPGRAPFDLRVKSVCRQRRLYFEHLSSLFAAADTWARVDSPIQSFIAQDRCMLRSHLANTFASELRCTGDSAEGVLDVLEVTTGWQQWRLLRTSLSPNAAERRIEHLTGELFG